MYASKQSKPAEKRTENTILNPNCGLTWISNKLKDNSSTTQFRILPSFDSNGNEEFPYYPDGDISAPKSCLANAFANMEVLHFYQNGVTYDFVTSIQEADNKGALVPPFSKTPAKCIFDSMGWVMFAQNILLKKGYDSEIPDRWMNYLKYETFSFKPTTFVMAQCLVTRFNGEPTVDANKKPVLFGVFGIPTNAEGNFLKTVVTKVEPEEPLSWDNIPSHFDIVRLDNGFLLTLSRADNSQGLTYKGKPKAEYSITPVKKYPVSKDLATSIVKPWTEVFNVPTLEDSIARMLDLFGPEVVDYGLQKTPYIKYLSSEYVGSSTDFKFSFTGKKKAVLEAIPNKAPVEAAKVETKTETKTEARTETYTTETPIITEPVIPTFDTADGEDKTPAELAYEETLKKAVAKATPIKKGLAGLVKS
jgi:hypothetical protein